jgi:hypothetical protein
MAGNPQRYFQSWWIRDFFTMSLRASPVPDQFAPQRQR